MDLEEFRSFISDSGVDVWTWIDMAISVASADHQIELRNRRDGIIQKLYTPPFSAGCENCVKRSDMQNHEIGSQRIESEKNVARIEEEDDEQTKILEIKNLIDDHRQSEKSLIELLQRLLDMNTTFKALKETEIGRHVTKLRKHSSEEVRRLVKILVRKWKDTVDEWVRQSTPLEEESTEFNGDRKLPGPGARIPNAVSCNSTPPKRRRNDNGMELKDEEHQESQRAKKQVVEISNFKNSIISNNGGSVPIRFW